jgi:predicted ATP-dependent serine protease
VSDKDRADVLEKISSGIEGFDDITCGGLPLRRTTLLMGGPGCGKTVFALQMLVSAAMRESTPGIFVAFEEEARRVSANAETFGWNMRELEKKQIFFIDACMRTDVVMAGAFDLTGLLAGLEAKAAEMGAKLIVFDAIDVLLSLLDDSGGRAPGALPAARMAHRPRVHRHHHDEDRGGLSGHGAALRLHALHGRLRGAAHPAHLGSRGGAGGARAQVPRLAACAQ